MLHEVLCGIQKEVAQYISEKMLRHRRFTTLSQNGQKLSF